MVVSLPILCGTSWFGQAVVEMNEKYWCTKKRRNCQPSNYNFIIQVINWSWFLTDGLMQKILWNNIRMLHIFIWGWRVALVKWLTLLQWIFSLCWHFLRRAVLFLSVDTSKDPLLHRPSEHKRLTFADIFFCGENNQLVGFFVHLDNYLSFLIF